MEKDAFYFPHFSNARNDKKLKRARKELGIEGYGIFFMLLEILREESDFKYPMKDIDLLADDFGTSEQKVRTIIANYDLFEVDEQEMFFSSNLIKFLEPYINMKEQRRIAGIKSGEARKAKALILLENERQFNGSSTVVQRELNENEQSKVNKGKDIYTLSFECFWREYPKKKDKGHAFKEWLRQIKSTEESTIIEGAKKYASECRNKKTEEQYIKMGQGWLSGQRWLDQETLSVQPRRILQ